MADVLHLTGPVLVGPVDVRDEVWVVDGQGHLHGTDGAAQTVAGWVLPGLVDAHCHVGLGPEGAVDETDLREAGDRPTATPGPCSSATRQPVDTRWVDDRDDLPRLIRAGRHIARSRRYLRGFAHEVEPEDVVAYVRQEARRGDGWVKLVGDWIDQDTGDLSPSFPREIVVAAVAARTRRAPGPRRTASARSRSTTSRRRDRLHRARLRPRARVDRPVRCAGDRHRPHPHQHRPAARDGRAGPGQVPARTTPTRSDLHQRRYETVAAAHDAGIPIYLGTDAAAASARPGRRGGCRPRGRGSHSGRGAPRAGCRGPRVLGGPASTRARPISLSTKPIRGGHQNVLSPRRPRPAGQTV